MFLFDLDIVLKKIKQYSEPEPDPELLAHHESFFQTPKTVQHSLELGEAFAKRIDHKLNSLTRKHIESYKSYEQILQVADIQQGDLISIQTATKEAIRQKAINRNYIISKGPISARAAIQAVAKKEARKRPKEKLVVEVSSDDSNTDNEYKTLHPELAG